MHPRLLADEEVGPPLVEATSSDTRRKDWCSLPYPQLDQLPHLNDKAFLGNRNGACGQVLFPEAHEGTKGSAATPSRLIISEAHFSDGNLPDSFPSGTGFGARLD